MLSYLRVICWVLVSVLIVVPSSATVVYTNTIDATLGSAGLNRAIDLSSYFQEGSTTYNLENISVVVNAHSDQADIKVLQETGPWTYVGVVSRYYNGHWVQDTYYSRQVSIIDRDQKTDEISVNAGTSDHYIQDTSQTVAGPYLNTSFYGVGSLQYGYTYYSTDTRLVIDGYYGPFSGTFALSSAEIASVNAAQSLTLNFANSSGTSVIDAVSIQFDQIVVTVPEMNTWALLVIGMGMIGCAIRCRKSRFDYNDRSTIPLAQ